VDKYRPHTFDKFVLHKDVAEHLRALVATGDCPHTLFYGPPGAGKKTLVTALLREIYGAGADKARPRRAPLALRAGRRRRRRRRGAPRGSALGVGRRRRRRRRLACSLLASLCRASNAARPSHPPN